METLTKRFWVLLVAAMGSLAVGLFLYLHLRLLLYGLVFVGLAGLPVLARNYKEWLLFGAPTLGFSLSLLIGPVVL